MDVNDFCTQITNQIIEDLKAGTPTWIKPWTTGQGGCNPMTPHNCTTGREYSGMNILILWMSAMSHGYTSNSWAGFKQMQAIGGRLCKRPGYEPPSGKPHATGQLSTAIVRVNPRYKKDENGDKKLVGRSVFINRVFNLDQFEGYDADKLATLSSPLEIPDDDRFFAAQTLSDAQGIAVNHGGDVAGYYPGFDQIVMPVTFEDYDHYYATLFHEHIHATGHPKRLDRTLTGNMESEDYAFEELVAELGAAFMCSHTNITGDLRHAFYIESWIKRLENDHRAIFKAARLSQQAMEYMLLKAGHKAPAIPDAIAA